MQLAEAVDFIAAELSIFDWVPDSDGKFSTMIPQGIEVRLLPCSDQELLLEASICRNFKEVASTRERILSVLKINFSQAIHHQTSLYYLPEIDELVASRRLNFGVISEEALAQEVESFLEGARGFSSAFRNLFPHYQPKKWAFIS